MAFFMSKKEFVIYGARDIGVLIAHEHSLNKILRDYSFGGFIDDLKQGKVNGYPIIGNRVDLSRLRKEGVDNIIVTMLDNPVKRLELCLELEKMGFDFPSIYNCNIPEETQIGKGVHMHDSVVLFGNQKIGDHSTIGPYVLIEGRTNIGKGVFMRPQCFIGYGVQIGDATTINVKASIMPGLRIGKGCVIGPHVLQTKDLEDGQKNLRYNNFEIKKSEL